MTRADLFDFTDVPSINTEAFVVRVPAGVTTLDALFESLYERAHLPVYFGFNWDAFSDCLRDLHWIDSHDIVLLHVDIPKLPQQELRTYVDVLAECAESWIASKEHSLKVVFPRAARLELTNHK
jgi:hypothetical protein